MPHIPSPQALGEARHREGHTGPGHEKGRAGVCGPGLASRVAETSHSDRNQELPRRSGDGAVAARVNGAHFDSLPGSGTSGAWGSLGVPIPSRRRGSGARVLAETGGLNGPWVGHSSFH